MVSVCAVESVVEIGARELAIVRPRDSDVLIDEDGFEREEFLPYWAELWPSGPALARTVSERPLLGRHVLELGCGLALPSIVAALGGARVLASDWSPDAVALAWRNARRNDARIETAVVDWRAPGRLLGRAPWELVLASDVLYEPRNAETLLELLPRLVDGEGEILLADPGRPAESPFLARAAETFAIASVRDPLTERVRIHSLRPRRRRGG
jgi:predicted nicotinamide N-methyase